MGGSHGHGGHGLFGHGHGGHGGHGSHGHGVGLLSELIVNEPKGTDIELQSRRRMEDQSDKDSVHSQSTTNMFGAEYKEEPQNSDKAEVGLVNVRVKRYR